MKVATLKRHYLTPSGKIDKEVPAKTLRTGMVVTESYIESVNNDTASHGKFFVVDEEATKEYYEKGTEKNKIMKEKAALKEIEKANILTSALQNITKASEAKSESGKKSPGRPPKSEETN